MFLNIEIECPYCEKKHVHRIEVFPPRATPEVDELEYELPHDDETEDLEKFREEEQEVGDDIEVP